LRLANRAPPFAQREASRWKSASCPLWTTSRRAGQERCCPTKAEVSGGAARPAAHCSVGRDATVRGISSKALAERRRSLHGQRSIDSAVSGSECLITRASGAICAIRFPLAEKRDARSPLAIGARVVVLFSPHTREVANFSPGSPVNRHLRRLPTWPGQGPPIRQARQSWTLAPPRRSIHHCHGRCWPCAASLWWWRSSVPSRTDTARRGRFRCPSVAVPVGPRDSMRPAAPASLRNRGGDGA
jgi:hypothetical protein